MQLVARPTGQIVDGEIRLSIDGGKKAVNIANMPLQEMTKIRGSEVSMIQTNDESEFSLPHWASSDEVIEPIIQVDGGRSWARTIHMLTSSI